MSETAVIFGMQRCGSNFFLSACTRFDDVTVFGEMYHRAGAFPFCQDDERDFAIKQDLARSIWESFRNEGLPLFYDWDFAASYDREADLRLNEKLAGFSYSYPQKYFEAVQDIAPDSRIILKIFPEHLSIFQILSILHECRPHVILMIRNPLDSFISFKKLEQTEAPQDIDTSDIKIDFNKAEYFEYKAGLVAYFGAIKAFCEDEMIDVTVVSYEDLHDDDGRDKVEKVRVIMEQVFESPVRAVEGKAGVGLFVKQDRSGSTADKVANPVRLPRSQQRLID